MSENNQVIKKTPETYAEGFIQKHKELCENSRLECILEAFVDYIRPEPGKYNYSPKIYASEFIRRYSEKIEKASLLITLESYTLFVCHCHKFAVNWVFYADENGLER